jgi:tetraacyldisaccharide 4'-kinase
MKQPGLWRYRGIAAALLWPVSLLFKIIVKLRITAYRIGIFRAHRLPVPVVIVGNIYIGGTGKTPMTIWVADVLKRANFQPGIISRGYGSKNIHPKEVHPDSDAKACGDEPILIRQKTNCPVVIGRNRPAAAKHLLQLHPQVDIIISDDGLQHYAMDRDIEIVLFDNRGAGNGWMLPAGPLREPLSRHRDFTVVNSMNFPAPGNRIYSRELFHMQLQGDEAEQLINRSRRISLDELAENAQSTGLKIAAVAGIGNPWRFFMMLKMRKIQPDEYPQPDHFEYTNNPFAKIDADVILITEKDAVKCAQIKAIAEDERIWVVPVKAHIDGDLEQKILERCREYGVA